MGQTYHVDKEYFADFDPAKFAARIKAQAAAGQCGDDSCGDENITDNG